MICVALPLCWTQYSPIKDDWSHWARHWGKDVKCSVGKRELETETESRRERERAGDRERERARSLFQPWGIKFKLCGHPAHPQWLLCKYFIKDLMATHTHAHIRTQMDHSDAWAPCLWSYHFFVSISCINVKCIISNISDNWKTMQKKSSNLWLKYMATRRRRTYTPWSIF